MANPGRARRAPVVRHGTIRAQCAHRSRPGVPRSCRSDVRSYEKVQSHRRNPGLYLDEAMGGVFLLIMMEFAPLPQRLRSALGRVREPSPRLAEGLAEYRAVPGAQGLGRRSAWNRPNRPVVCSWASCRPWSPRRSPTCKKNSPPLDKPAAEAVQAYAAFLQDEVLPQGRDHLCCRAGIVRRDAARTAYGRL